LQAIARELLEEIVTRVLKNLWRKRIRAKMEKIQISIIEPYISTTFKFLGTHNLLCHAELICRTNFCSQRIEKTDQVYSNTFLFISIPFSNKCDAICSFLG
jgi:hypothetical protein